MPANSSNDAQTLPELMRDYRAFPRVRSKSIRRNLEERAMKCGRILTLKSFCKDVIYLQTAYVPWHELFSTEERSLQRACEWSFRGDTHFFRALYIELWLLSLRNYEYLSDLTSANAKKDKGCANFERRGRSEAKISELASFAATRGLDTAQINQKLARYPALARTELTSSDIPDLSWDGFNLPQHLRRNRSGRSDFARDSNRLSLRNIFHLPQQPLRKFATSFAVTIDIVHCFFGERPPVEPAPECCPFSTNAEATSIKLVRPPSLCYGESNCPPSSLHYARTPPCGSTGMAEGVVTLYAQLDYDNLGGGRHGDESVSLGDAAHLYNPQQDFANFSSRHAGNMVQTETSLMLPCEAAQGRFQQRPEESEQAAIPGSAQLSVRLEDDGVDAHWQE